MSNIFSETEVLRLPRSFQKMSWNIKTTLNYGKIYPIMAIDCVPGDTIKISGSLNIRAKQMVYPNLTPNKVTVHFFFVPYRLLDENFSKGVMGVTEKGDVFDYEFPKWTKTATEKKMKTLWDYFGLPINVKVNTSGNLVEDNTNVTGMEPTKYLLRAYNKIYNDMYRNENYVDEVDLDDDSLKYRCWRADYFTKALPWQQKPSEANYFALPVNTTMSSIGPTIPLSVTADSLNGGTITKASPEATSISIRNAAAQTQYYTTDGWTKIIVNSPTRVNTDYPNDVDATTLNNSYMNISIPTNNVIKRLNLSSTSFDVSDMRLAFQMQKWAERNARGGTRYDEYIKAHFGITPKDARLQLPEFLGGFKFPILCGENYSTSATENAPQGTRAGIGNGMGGDKIRKYFCEEYGVIIGLASVLPQAEYQQGLNRMWLKHDQLDWYHHELCCLSEREVYQGELVCSNLEDNARAKKANRQIFGYTGIYNEYRFMPNTITGEMRFGEYANWHQSRIMNAGSTTDDDGNEIPKVKLSQTFVEARNIRLSPFANIENGMEDPFIVQAGFTVKAFRPMTYTAEPGLIDHF